MKKVAVLFLLLLCVPVSAHAWVDIDIDYTGRSFSKFADTIAFPATIQNDPSYLGGYPARNSKEINAYQFTVSQNSTVNYLSINALVSPNTFEHDAALSNYISQLREQGATTEEIAAAIPGFVSPAQSITVDFLIIQGSVPKINDLPQYTPLPSTKVLSSASYQFYTDNGLNTKTYQNLLVPLSPLDVTLTPEEDYWIYAKTPQLSNVRIDYSAGLVGQVNTPEPGTIMLTGGGLVGMLLRRGRKRLTRSA